MDRRDRRERGNVFRRFAAELLTNEDAARARGVERAITADGQVVTSQLNAPIPPNLTSVVDAVSVRTAADNVSTKTDLAGHLTDFASAIVARFISPMTTRGDMIRRGAAAAERLPVGTSGQVLTSDGTDPNWAASTGMVSPMTTRGDMIRRSTTGPERVALGTSGQVLTSNGTDPAWATPPSSLSNPMTTPADLIVGGTAGAPARLGKGANGQVLTVDPTSGLLVWATPATGGMSDPTTTKGDVIARGASAVGRLGVGTDGQVLTADAAQTLGVKWAAASAGGGVAASQETFGLRAGRFVTPYQLRDGLTTMATTGVPTVNRMHVQPYYWPVASTITAFGIYVNTIGAAGAKVQLGMCTINAQGEPVAGSIVDIGSVDATAAGQKTLTGLSIARSVGWFGVILLTNDAAIRLFYISASNGRDLYGQSTATGSVKAFGVYQNIAAGWTGLPSTFAVDGYESSYLFQWSATI